jgi:SAM-dependent methyltransferase
MISLFSSNYLARTPIEKAAQDFASRFNASHTILDIGCGNKPYAKYFTATYLGLDPYPETRADIIRDAWDSGLSDNSCDGVILNQSLEHIPDTLNTIREVRRVLKPGGLILVTVPQTMRNHSKPIPSESAPYKNFDRRQIPYWNDDYWRFTKFGLIYLFQDFTILELSETNGYLSTLIQLWNYFLASFGLGKLLAPFYFINNICALLIETFFRFLSGLPFSSAKKYDALINKGLTLNYILIAQLQKK